MRILFTICGRAGSKGLKNKNLKLFNGYPLVLYTLSAIDLFKKQIESTITVDIALNTDSSELKKIVKSYPNIIIVDRETNLASDSASKMSVIKDTLIKVEELTEIKFDLVIDLDITSPMRTVEDIQNLINEKIKNDELDIVFSVVNSRRNPYFNMVQEDEGYVSLIIQSQFTARQQTPKVFDMNASMYLYDPDFLKENDMLFQGKCGIVQMEDFLVLDIDSEEDFEWMTYIYPKVLEENIGIQNISDNLVNITNNV